MVRRLSSRMSLSFYSSPNSHPPSSSLPRHPAEFIKLWSEPKFTTEEDLIKALEAEGLTPAMSVTSSRPKPIHTGKKKGGKGRQQGYHGRMKITNTHLNADLSVKEGK